MKTDFLEVHAGASAEDRVVKVLRKGEAVSVAYEFAGSAGVWCAIVEEGRSPISGCVECRHLERNLERKTSSRVRRAIRSRTIADAPKSAREERTAPSLEKEKGPASGVTAIIYMTSWCPYCKKAREYLGSLGVNLIEYDIEKDSAKEAEMTAKGGRGSVPFIDIEGIYISGYGEEEIKRAVERRRAF